MIDLRIARAEDWNAINALHHWAWFPVRSETGWAWMFSFSPDCPGWVLEDADGVCGFLGNLTQTYHRGPDVLAAATGYSLIVLPRARGGSHRLLQAFRAQPGVFAVSILNGNARSEPIYGREGFEPLPAGWADAKIVWPLKPLTMVAERVAGALFSRRRLERDLFSAPARPDGAAVFADKGVRTLDPIRDALHLSTFDRRLALERRLVPDRSPALLGRRFSDPDRTSDPVMLGWFNAGGLAATAIGHCGKMTEITAPILDVVDVVALPEAGAQAGPALLAAMKVVGRARGASRVRLPLVNPELAGWAASVPGGLVRRHHVHAHVRFDAEAADIRSAWTPTAYDGDYGFCLRHQPARDVRSGRRLLYKGFKGAFRPQGAEPRPA